jgi:hypothetical protein
VIELAFECSTEVPTCTRKVMVLIDLRAPKKAKLNGPAHRLGSREAKSRRHFFTRDLMMQTVAMD